MRDTSGEVNLGQLLLRAFRWFDEGLVASLRAAGWTELTRANSLVFANLDMTGTRTAEVARRAGVSRQAIHVIVQDLQRQGLVEQQPDPTNRSAKLVVPTEDGLRSARAAMAVYTELEAELARRISPASIAELRRALEKDWGPPAPRAVIR